MNIWKSVLSKAIWADKKSKCVIKPRRSVCKSLLPKGLKLDGDIWCIPYCALAAARRYLSVGFFNKKVNWDWDAIALNLTFLSYVLVLLYILSSFLVDCTVHFHYCITLSYVLFEKSNSYVIFYFLLCYTALPIIRMYCSKKTGL